MASSENSFRRPPGPKERISLGVDEATLERLIEMRDKFGNISSMTTENGRLVYLVNDADEVQRLLTKKHSKYIKGPGFERIKLLVGNGIIVSDGAVWRRSRTMIAPGFTRAHLARLIDLIVPACKRKAVEWRQIVAANGTIDITRDMNDFALELIMRATFGPDYETYFANWDENPFSFLSEDTTRDMSTVVKLRTLRKFVLEIITARRESGLPEDYDFLSIYVAARDADGQPFTDNELLDEVMSLVVAGFETSAGTLNWAWWLIANHPEVDARLFDEAQRVIPAGTAIDRHVTKELVYHRQVLDETLRLYPPVWLFSRRAIADDTIGEFDVPKGTDIYLSPYILQRTAEYWAKPDEFDPEHFAVEGEKRAAAKRQAAFIPFSLGPRRCIGEYFAFLEMGIHLSILLQQFRMSPVSGDDPGIDIGINLRSRDNIRLKPNLRG